jgi:hypothetical protein
LIIQALESKEELHQSLKEELALMSKEINKIKSTQVITIYSG